ncbi:hypothetical protein RSK20926_20580 [Roseobacter sp. SK209-2-6]|uniref:rcc01693 family protein n=1 Tax=Roseobacter sp. SK209-2-6 TaxID=388739 RepID=UPI0000F3E764|nr:rcc01693 family protein [Roseobacter sp. SK209-2-6]EBA16160.1 hypothetical protein RSK20926_20580 [Roseobacter sp. SK209-2-6]
MTGLDWQGMLHLGVGRLGLRPEAFWKLTPAEFFLMLGPNQSMGPMQRDTLKRLMESFPDLKDPSEENQLDRPGANPFMESGEPHGG